MLLVMSTAGIFEHKVDGPETQEGQAQPLHLKGDSKSRQYSALWQVYCSFRISSEPYGCNLMNMLSS